MTQLLAELRNGDEGVVQELLPIVIEELQGLARAVFSRQNPAHTLQPTALVNEAWIKLAGNLAPIEDRRHFFVVAGRAMRHVLADHARTRLAEKRGGAHQRVTLDTSLYGNGANDALDLVELEDSLTKLGENNERLARVAELRLFSGFSIEETAETLGLSKRSIDSDWAMAKAWLRRDLAGER